MGLRSSCAASATKRLCRSTAVSSRSRVPFTVVASAAISSFELGTGTRWCRSRAVMSATLALIAATGPSARPTESQVMPATTSSSAGTPGSSAPYSVFSASSALSSEARPITTAGPAAVATWALATAYWPGFAQPSAASARLVSRTSGSAIRATVPSFGFAW